MMLAQFPSAVTVAGLIVFPTPSAFTAKFGT
jgi:hypothetical protein